MNAGWTRESHLAALGLEQKAGLVDLQRRMPRDGVPAEKPVPKKNEHRIDNWDSMPMDEFDKLQAANYALGPAESKRIGHHHSSKKPK